MTDKIKSKMRMLSEKSALEAIDELASVERRRINTFSSYFMGILNKKIRDPDAPSKKSKQDHGASRNGRDVSKTDKMLGESSGVDECQRQLMILTYIVVYY